jgi:hypothetical protein
VIAETNDPQFSQAIANAYVDGYLKLLEDQSRDVIAPITQQIDEIRNAIARNNVLQAERLAPYLDPSRSSNRSHLTWTRNTSC